MDATSLQSYCLTCGGREGEIAHPHGDEAQHSNGMNTNIVHGIVDRCREGAPQEELDFRWCESAVRQSEDLLHRIESFIRDHISASVEDQEHASCPCRCGSCSVRFPNWECGCRGCVNVSSFQSQREHGKHLGLTQERTQKLCGVCALGYCLDPRALAHRLQEALELLVDILRLLGPPRVSVSFNGGKEAVAILHLYRAALIKYDRLQRGEEKHGHKWQTSGVGGTVEQCSSGTNSEASVRKFSLRKPRAIYFYSHADEFPEVESFVHETGARYDFDFRTYRSGWASGIANFIGEQQLHPQAFIIGTRKSDPQGRVEALGFVQPSSRWLPAFFRVQPLLNFSYGQIWWFLREMRLPYCKMYTLGYSSIGTKSNTRVNPFLISADGRILPAWELQGWEHEREGRDNVSEGADGSS